MLRGGGGGGEEFHRDAPANVRLDLNRSNPGLRMLILVYSPEELIGKKSRLMKVEHFQTLFSACRCLYYISV